MAERSVVIIGLPASGKTTYLAALWHLIVDRDFEMSLRFGNLRTGDSGHLNAIATRWREAMVQERTAIAGRRLVSMNLIDTANQAARVTFPDVPGEAFRQMWEGRDCEPAIAEILRCGDVLLFVHADTIRAPRWIADEVALSIAVGIERPGGQTKAWDPRLSPTQVQLVDLLQLFRIPPLDVGPRRLAIVLSAWDTVRDEGLTPIDFLRSRLPLLNQYLRRGADDWTWRIYGLSAQGGTYDKLEDNAERVPEAEELRKLDRPSKRIQLVGPVAETHDLTEPLAWLMD